jgi:hypothetical protein
MADIQGKLCRICWNIDQWRRPSGSASSDETGSYVSDNGFGHEEWLFNFEWLIDGHRNGFIQGIHKFLTTYEGQTFPILLYTITPRPDRKHLAVAVIRKAYVPTEAELSHVRDECDARGWLDQMRQDLRRIGVPTTPLVDPEPKSIATIRFSPGDVRRFDPMPQFTPGENGAPNITSRYTAFHWDGSLGFLGAQATASDLGSLPEEDPRRSEVIRQRAAQQGTEFDPKHVRMQNLLFESLKKRHKSVTYEMDFIDLAGHDPGSITYYELKTDATAKMCIRKAIGQLLEYSHYPPAKPAERLVVVGDAPPTDDDRMYLQFLRQRFGLDIH